MEELISSMSAADADSCRTQVAFEARQPGGQQIVAAAGAYFGSAKVQKNTKLSAVKDLADLKGFKKLANAHGADPVQLAKAVHRLYSSREGCVRNAPAFATHQQAAKANSANTGIQKKRKVTEALIDGGVEDPTPEQVSAVLSGKIAASRLKSLGAAFDPNGGSVQAQHEDARRRLRCQQGDVSILPAETKDGRTVPGPRRSYDRNFSTATRIRSNQND